MTGFVPSRAFFLVLAVAGASCGSGDSDDVDDPEGPAVTDFDLLFANASEDLCGTMSDGSRQTVLKAATTFDDYDYFAQMAISPDGTRIVYAAACAGSRFLRSMSAALGEPEDLTERCGPSAQWPAFSPDGSLIAFIASNWQDEERGMYLYVMNADGSSPHRVSPLDGIYNPQDRGPAFSADGSRIFFTSGRGGTSQVWSIALDGSDMRTEVASEGYVGDPVPHWVAVDTSGSGSLYVVMSQVSTLDNTANLYLFPLGGGTATRVTNEAEHSLQRPAVSPDGQQVAFSRVFDFSTQDLQMLEVGTGTVSVVSDSDFSGYYDFPVFVPAP